MGANTKANLKHDVDDAATKFGLSPGSSSGLRGRRFEAEQSGASYQQIAP